MKIIPWKKRKAIHVVIASVAVVLFALAAIGVWYPIVVGVRDVLVILGALLITAGFGCSLMALITGRMEWLLMGIWGLAI